MAQPAGKPSLQTSQPQTEIQLSQKLPAPEQGHAEAHVARDIPVVEAGPLDELITSLAQQPVGFEPVHVVFHQDQTGAMALDRKSPQYRMLRWSAPSKVVQV